MRNAHVRILFVEQHVSVGVVGTRTWCIEYGRVDTMQSSYVQPWKDGLSWQIVCFSFGASESNTMSDYNATPETTDLSRPRFLWFVLLSKRMSISLAAFLSCSVYLTLDILLLKKVAVCQLQLLVWAGYLVTQKGSRLSVAAVSVSRIQK